MDEGLKFTPTDFAAVVNQSLEYGFSNILIEGEVASFKINQGKWVFFDLKDDNATVSCFMVLYQLRMPIEDGMKIIVKGTPKITKQGKFSFTVTALKPVGEGSIKKSFEILKKKLADEGLFDLSKKRKIPEYFTNLGVISSPAAAGYADFIKILNARWGGIKIKVAKTQVQGLDAPEPIIRALHYFNERGDVEVIAILRGGGSADDLACFNDEGLVRAVAASKIPIITGIGHEVDESLVDLAADRRASTPSNAAELLTPDRKDVLRVAKSRVADFYARLCSAIEAEKQSEYRSVERVSNIAKVKLDDFRKILENQIKTLEALNPDEVLRRGYSIITGKISPGDVVKITTFDKIINAEIKEVYERK